MRIRVVLSIVAVLLAVPLFAQSNEIGFFVNGGSFQSTTENDPDLGVTAKLKFDSKAGYGVNFRHSLSPNTSIDFSAQKLKADAKLDISGAGLSGSLKLGTLDLDQIDMAYQWHFVPRGMVDPYVGGGVAWMSGGKLKVDDDPANGVEGGSLKLDHKLTWLADAGIDFRVTPNAAIMLQAKYTHYSSGVDAEPGDPVQKLKLDPITLALGLRWKF